MRGKFIVLEGIDGSGKDTQEKLLKKEFSDFVYFHVLDEEKAHTNNLRIAMFKSSYKWQTLPEMLLFWADKFEAAQEMKKLVEAGKNVICNRWEASNLAYQLHGKGSNEESFIRMMQTKLDEVLKPDLYILFDISSDESSKRRSMRSAQEGGNSTDNYYDQSKKDFFDRVILGYKQELKNYNHVVINGEQSREKVFEDTLSAINNVLK